MNSALRVVYLALIFSLIYLNKGNSQALFNPKTGVGLWSIKDEMGLEEKSHHSGQTIGFDMHLHSNRFIFAPGFHYHRISVLNKQEGFQYNLKKGNHIHYFNIPMTAGYQLFDFKVVDLSIMAGAEAFFFFNLDSNDVGLKVDEIFGVIPALTGVIQTKIFSFITLDVKYHHALHEMVKKRKDSMLSGFSFDVGVIF